MRQLRYPPKALLGDYLRSAAGLFVGLGVLAAVPPGPVTIAIFGSLAALFAVFGLRTAYRHSLRVAVSDEAIACRGATTKVIPWHELSAVKLRYFGARKSKWRPLGSGFMQLTLKGKGSAMTFESSIEDFDWLAGRAAAALAANGHRLDAATVSNLIELGIDPHPPSDGCDSSPNVL
ncbi:MAG: hypothetical protein Kow00114_13300 [Kiloniellaceae bacterium]